MDSKDSPLSVYHDMRISENAGKRKRMKVSFVNNQMVKALVSQAGSILVCETVNSAVRNGYLGWGR